MSYKKTDNHVTFINYETWLYKALTVYALEYTPESIYGGGAVAWNDSSITWKVFNRLRVMFTNKKSVIFSREEPLHNSTQQPMCIQQPDVQSKTKSYNAVQSIKIKVYGSNFLHHKAQFTYQSIAKCLLNLKVCSQS